MYVPVCISTAQACEFLHESGVLLYFAESRGDLQDYVFIDRQWLYDIMSCVVHVDPNSQEPVSRKRCKGVLRTRWLPQIVGDRLPENLYPLLLGVLEHFHIIVALNTKRTSFLVPALLPAAAPRSGSFGFRRYSTRFHRGQGEEGDIHLPLSDALLRQYQLSYIPVSFWSKLISSLVVLFTEQKGSASSTSQSLKTSRTHQTKPRELQSPGSADEVDGVIGRPEKKIPKPLHAYLPAERPIFEASSTATISDTSAGQTAVHWSKPGLSSPTQTGVGMQAATDLTTQCKENSGGDAKTDESGGYCWDSTVSALDDSSEQSCSLEETDGSLIAYRVRNFVDRLTIRRTSDLLSSLAVEPGDVSMVE